MSRGVAALLPKPVEDAVLLSAGSRYTDLVQRAHLLYGQIGPEEMQQIVTRGVAMKSNLHNVIFEPGALTLWIAHAGRHQPACDQPYRQLTWADLFPHGDVSSSHGYPVVENVWRTVSRGGVARRQSGRSVRGDDSARRGVVGVTYPFGVGGAGRAGRSRWAAR